MIGEANMIMTIDLKRYSRNLYRAAGKKDLSLSEIERQTGLSFNTIKHIFDGDKAGRLDTFLAIATVLETDYNELLEGVVKKDA